MESSTHKPTVYYYPDTLSVVKAKGGGSIAILRVKEHPSPLVINGEMARTSLIQSHDETTGTIETLNTIYLPEDTQ